ncbi:MAG: DUF3916 domain-containing protein [Bacillota bacterium]
MREKKVRGKRRKTSNLINRIEKNTVHFPKEFYNGYWQMRLPVDQGFINSKKTPRGIKNIVIQTLLQRVSHLIEIKPHDEWKYRVAALVSVPDLWRSEIIVFKGESYFEFFFNRNDEYQKWIPLSDKRNIQTEWRLSISDELQIVGYKEVIYVDGDYSEGEIWFVGELT